MKILWNGDAGINTGFARVSHNVLTGLQAAGWEVHVLGINYFGDPHPYPYPIYPAVPGGDVMGYGRIGALIAKIKPDVVVLQNDPWNIAEYLCGGCGDPATWPPVVAVMPVDGTNMRPAKALNKLALAVWWTDFGQREAELGGYTGPSVVIPLGIDPALYRPRSKPEAWARWEFASKLPPDAYVVGAVNRNHPRKRFDLTIESVATWVRQHKRDNVYLYLHCAQRDMGYDVVQLADYFGINTRLIITDPRMAAGAGLYEREMPLLYAAFDVQLSTTQGEGWGLTNHEGMACGVPQIVPDYAALGEWPRGAVHYVPVREHAVTAGQVNVVGGVVAVPDVVDALERVYRDAEYRRALGAAGLARATEPRFTWPVIAAQYDVALRDVLEKQKANGVAA
jgi:D-inositol-3-phosphate glycosyltransferase